MKEPPIGVKSTNLFSQVNNNAFYTLKRNVSDEYGLARKPDHTEDWGDVEE